MLGGPELARESSAKAAPHPRSEAGPRSRQHERVVADEPPGGGLTA